MISGLQKLVYKNIAVVAMFLLLGFHILIVHTQELSTWKGGGMGMFASIFDRRVTVEAVYETPFVTDITASVSVLYPRALQKVLYMPTPGHATSLLTKSLPATGYSYTDNYFILKEKPTWENIGSFDIRTVTRSIAFYPEVTTAALGQGLVSVIELSSFDVHTKQLSTKIVLNRYQSL